MTSPATLSSVRVRRARFEDVPAALRLIAAAIERGCRHHYDSEQRRIVFLGYAGSLFVDVVGPFDTVVAEREGQLVGVAQLDAADHRLRALFVAAELQGQGLGRALLTVIERRARAHGLDFIQGAMSLNAAPFYARAGFERVPGSEHLMSARLRVPVVPMRKRLSA